MLKLTVRKTPEGRFQPVLLYENNQTALEGAPREEAADAVELLREVVQGPFEFTRALTDLSPEWELPSDEAEPEEEPSSLVPFRGEEVTVEYLVDQLTWYKGRYG